VVLATISAVLIAIAIAIARAITAVVVATVTTLEARTTITVITIAVLVMAVLVIATAALVEARGYTIAASPVVRALAVPPLLWTPARKGASAALVDAEGSLLRVPMPLSPSGTPGGSRKTTWNS